MCALRRPSVRARAALACLLILAAWGAGLADDEAERGGRQELRGGQWGLPETVRISFGDFIEHEHEVQFFGFVVIEAGDARIQAESVAYDRNRGAVEAVGNVVLTFPGAALAGSRLTYHIESQTGTIDDVVGYLDQDNAAIRARRAERVDPEHLAVEHAVFTTCTQPTPYWSFHLSRGTFHLGNYAYLHHASFWAGKVPLFYTPYLVWPIKTGRATGLLFPELRSSSKLGASIGVPFYWPFAENADLTTTVSAYSKVGFGAEAVLDWLPSWQGWAKGDGRFINDQVKKKSRYWGEWRHNQRFGEQFQLTASLETVSDFDYFTDYETDLIRAASPGTTSVIDFTRTWSWYSLSLRARRYLQYYVLGPTLLSGEGVNRVLPQIEWRGRSQRLGRTPLFLSFEASAAAFEREILGPPADAVGVENEDDLVTVRVSDWGRLDVAPHLQAPLLKSAIADLTLSGGWRGTWYTDRLDPAQPEIVGGESVFRTLWNAGLSFSGPRFQRVFQTPDWSFSPKLKHVIEPFVNYQWRSAVDAEASEAPVFDEVDAAPNEQSDLTYGIRQRFVALRRASSGPARGLASARETSFDGLEQQQKEESQREQKLAQAPEAKEQVQTSETLGPVEIASFDITQSYSFSRTLSNVYDTTIDPDTAQVTSVISGRRHYSPVRLRLRFNPTSDQLADVAYLFDPANGQLVETSISTLIRLSERGYASGTWYRRNPADPLLQETDFLRARWGVVSLGRRISVEIDWDWNIETSRLEHQRYLLRWGTQCCAFHFGYDVRDFEGNFSRDFSLAVDLSGLGEVLNLRTSTGR